MVAYPMIVMPLSPEDGGGFEAVFPDLPGCVSDGATPEAAVANAVAMLAGWTQALAEQGVAIPAPFSASEALHRRDEELMGALGSAMEYTDAVEARLAALEARLGAALDRNQDDWMRLLPFLLGAQRRTLSRRH